MFEFFRRVDIVEHLFGDDTLLIFREFLPGNRRHALSCEVGESSRG
jgi:hypothetical protein